MTMRNRKRKDGGIYFRPHNEFFETPKWAIDAYFQRLTLEENPCALDWHAGVDFLEPAAGEGAVIRSAREHLNLRTVSAVELNPSRSIILKNRLLASHLYAMDVRHFAVRAMARGWKYDSIVTNPPFSLAQTYAESMIPLLRPGGKLALLLRLAFMESQERVKFHIANPSDIYVLPRRPSFFGDGKSDMAAYAWFSWPGKGHWEILQTPAAVHREREIKLPPPLTRFAA